jgi:hypothetical protein
MSARRLGTIRRRLASSQRQGPLHHPAVATQPGGGLHPRRAIVRAIFPGAAAATSSGYLAHGARSRRASSHPAAATPTTKTASNTAIEPRGTVPLTRASAGV